jgi:hypothetical protein
MRVQVGPVTSGSVTLWVAYARTVLAQALSGSDPAVPAPAPEAVEAFERYLNTWEAIAERDTEFLWVADVDAEEIEFLAHVWFGMATALAERASKRGFPLSPPEGDEFYQALLRALLDGLAHEGRSLLEFSEQLRDAWPGLKED